MDNKPITTKSQMINKIAEFHEVLTRKTQECEELKFKIHDLRQLRELDREARERIVQQLDQLKAENEKLKNEIEACYNQVEDFDIIATSKSNKLKQAEQKLEKIQGIAKDFHYAIIPFHRGINHEMADRIDYYLNQILQIIDEVNDENM